MLKSDDFFFNIQLYKIYFYLFIEIYIVNFEYERLEERRKHKLKLISHLAVETLKNFDISELKSFPKHSKLSRLRGH